MKKKLLFGLFLLSIAPAAQALQATFEVPGKLETAQTQDGKSFKRIVLPSGYATADGTGKINLTSSNQFNDCNDGSYRVEMYRSPLDPATVVFRLIEVINCNSN